MKKNFLETVFFGQNITFLRKKQGFKTQKSFAEVIEVSPSTLSQWESSVSFPDAKTILSLSEYFKVNLDALFHEDLQALSEKESVIEYRTPSTADIDFLKRELDAVKSRLDKVENRH